MVYTSYFAKAKAVPVGSVIYSIARSQPKSCNFRELKILAPPAQLLAEFKLHEDETAYIAEYRKHLNANKDAVMSGVFSLLEQYNRNPDKHIVLLCWEKPGDFCHRH